MSLGSHNQATKEKKKEKPQKQHRRVGLEHQRVPNSTLLNNSGRSDCDIDTAAQLNSNASLLGQKILHSAIATEPKPVAPTQSTTLV